MATTSKDSVMELSKWINAALMTILISLVGFIYHDYTTRQTDFNNKLMKAIGENAISIDAIKKYILIKDKVDIDGLINQSKWEQLLKEFETNPRGVEIIQESDQLIARPIFKR